jgi:hypothetical protein
VVLSLHPGRWPSFGLAASNAQLTRDGGALGLTDGADRGVQVFAHDTGSFVRIVDRSGRERIIRP